MYARYALVSQMLTKPKKALFHQTFVPTKWQSESTPTPILLKTSMALKFSLYNSRMCGWGSSYYFLITLPSAKPRKVRTAVLPGVLLPRVPTIKVGYLSQWAAANTSTLGVPSGALSAFRLLHTGHTFRMNIISPRAFMFAFMISFGNP